MASAAGSERDELLEAAMEPADQRRDDLVTAGARPVGLPAAMEPPTSCGMTRKNNLLAVYISQPQWSPPTSGGTTGAALDHRVVHVLAAMEPANQRRDDPSAVTRPGMLVVPQWSPPTSGRTMPRAYPIRLRATSPQWSPPTSGGTTRCR